MKLLAIDFGRKKLGLAVGDIKSKLAQPYGVVKNSEDVSDKIKKIVEGQGVDMVVVGVSESKVGEESRKFGRVLEIQLGIPIVFEDETLTTKEAQRLSIEAGIGRKKRKGKEDAYAAALILQSYFDGLE
ncbi:MAG: Holliday junction resolvase RuvX [Candidatus Woesebacteria bacterium]|jgi:putative Holliday junction resolvase